MLHQGPHEGSLLEVLDQALADEVVEVGAPVCLPLQRRRRVPGNLPVEKSTCQMLESPGRGLKPRKIRERKDKQTREQTDRYFEYVQVRERGSIFALRRIV